MSRAAPSAFATAGVLVCLAAGGPLVLAPLAGTLRSLAAACFAGSAALDARPLARGLLPLLALLLLFGVTGTALAALLRRRLDEVTAAGAGELVALAALALLAAALWPLARAGLYGAPDGAVLGRGAQALLWLAASAACARAAVRARARTH
ncbi:MAG: hypothetical protein U1A78_18245 [Polyangia bacterium]